MASPLTALVKRTWQGVGGRHWAHALVEKTNMPITVASNQPFRDGERFEVEKIGGDYIVRSRP